MPKRKYKDTKTKVIKVKARKKWKNKPSFSYSSHDSDFAECRL